MAIGYELTELLKFLDYLSEKGMLNKNTAVSRKAASNKMLGILDAVEQADVRDINLDDVAARFGNLEGRKYTPQSLQVYKSRVATALADFLRYKNNPATFKTKPGGGAIKLLKSTGSNLQSASTQPNIDMPSADFSPHRIPSIDIPVPLRTNCIIQINGIPVDLKPSEAKKIAAVIFAMVAVDDE